ncbi:MULTISPECIES: type II toxin-antitoxin system PemK/MazF family toxin [Methylosinus]|uniref:Type II toxin-antitoxin system PemK/MazF family toxin n=2 Tax=Methylosinus trichosporium TaxID=426 RepID=A0A2D2CY07_METT3|nr:MULTISPECIES: type II toxin-antitoxin system PemK/MazF family toxin [Methylosinus]ATQ67631.1 type II toxin-antitoxin system PemK/MazF family toxin [Methylosinus trichosporium OB3b]OBS52170.1 MazF family transcriptional regulator [Methylosinus sp. 3S-1]
MIPTAGDIVWAELDPVRGREQAGRRPALVLSDRSYHEISARAIICPVTSNMREWPFNVALPRGMRTKGAVLVDQIRAVDRSMRLHGLIETAPDEVLSEVRAKLAALVGFDVRDLSHL